MKAGYRIIPFFVIVLLAVNSGCVNKNYPSNQLGKDAITVSENNSTITKSNPEKLLFLSFKMVKAKPKNQVTLLNKIVSEGRAKNGWENSANPSDENFLLFSFLSTGDTTINYYLVHPLYKDLEMADENGKLHRKSVILDSTEFFIRTPMLENVKAVIVSEKIKGHQTQELLQLTL